MNAFVRDIIKKKTPCFFISPHLDDAALSCGGLIAELAGKTDVTVVTIFTKASSTSQTLSAKKSLHLSSFADSESYYAARRQEDKDAFWNEKVTLVHLDEVEALWRKKTHISPLLRFLGRLLPELVHIYPTYGFHIASGAVSPADNETRIRVLKKLASLIPKDAQVFAPLGVGNHVDHILTRQIVSEGYSPILWLDQPYLYRETKQKQRKIIANTAEEFLYSEKKKASIMSGYTSQIPLLFDQKTVPNLPEFYIFPH